MPAHNFIDLTGHRFSRWLVLGPDDSCKALKWLCRCDCGTEKGVKGANLRGGFSKSCGCLAREVTSKISRTHGLSGSPEHRIWKNMHTRCYNKENPAYFRYGGRGIVMCERWKNSFQNFLDDMGKRPTPTHSIDRIDNDGIYSPKNCRWATRKEQASNYSRNRHITYKGKTKILQVWVDELGLSYLKIYKRIVMRNWDVARAFETK